MSRLDPFRNCAFDVVVIGGGLSGAGAARDAVLRGFSVALFERYDYGSGSTSCRPRVIDPLCAAFEGRSIRGMRAESEERETLLRIAGHLVRRCEFLVPFYNPSLFRKWRALVITRWTAAGRRVLGRVELLREEPCLRSEGLEGGVVYRDAVVESPERLAVENVVAAHAHGAAALNYAEVTGISGDSGARTVQIRDRLDGAEAAVRARVLIDATRGGPQTFHCVLPAITKRAVYFYSRSGSRLFHLLPVAGLVHAWGSRADGALNAVLDSVAQFLPEAGSSPVYWTGTAAGAAPAGLELTSALAIGAGSPGTYRLRAERVVDRAAALLGSTARCCTATAPLPDLTAPLDVAIERAVKREQCHSLEDFMRRRSTLSLTEDQGLAAAPRVARAMAAVAGWSAGREEAEWIHYRQWVIRTREPMRRLSGSVRNTSAGA